MYTVQFLILFPCLAALVLLPLRSPRGRAIVVAGAACIVAAGTIILLATMAAAGYVAIEVPAEPTSMIMIVIEVLIALFLLALGLKYRQPLTIALVLVQTALMGYYEVMYGVGMHPGHTLFFDQFSLIMAGIIGVIGSLITIYAVGYMETYHRLHPGVPDRRWLFFPIIFVFLAAMFGLVFSDFLPWLFFFWEVTTLCSFLLIGYSKTQEAVTNSFLALRMNLVGGVAFAGALIALASLDPSGGLSSLSGLISSGNALVLLPALLLAVAGISKAALMPFSSWLVGAMVAPTPVSALLHSSTMVKAGVYLIVRLSPVFSGTPEGLLIGLLGGTTFLLASGIAISQTNAKRVLAYSTIANLGLITACAGVGTYKLVWAAILLIIFHAIAKSLLFLCVGTVEHRVGSRDIEDMTGLIVRMPKVAVMMFIGIAGMFLAPFGMLISKWAAIEGFIDAPFGLLFVAILAFGGSITVFFWSKWMGKILSVTPTGTPIEDGVRAEKWPVLTILSALTVAVCLLFPLISSGLIEPFLLQVYGETTRLSQDNIMIMAMMLCLLMVMPLSMLHYRRDPRKVTAYLGGRPAGADMSYAGSMGVRRTTVLSNYYLPEYFGEGRLLAAGTATCLGLLLVACIMVLGVVL